MERVRLGGWLGLALAVACSGGGGNGPAGPEEPPAPMIQSLEPNPVRAGEELIIRGSNLQAAALESAQQSVQVLLDGQPLTPISATNTEVVVEIPIEVEPGNHTLRVRTAGGDLTNTSTLAVHVFTVTGTYVALGPQTNDTCGVDDTPIGTVEEFEVSLTDNRPTLNIRVGGFRFNGSLGNGGDFQGQLQETDPGTGLVSTVSLNGNMQVADDGTAGFSAFLDLDFSGGVLPPCGIDWTLLGARVTTTPTDIGPFTFDLGSWSAILHSLQARSE
ncbi:MAG: IPT/TIG domain-containing protein [Gemmatimonadota bacterium]